MKQSLEAVINNELWDQFFPPGSILQPVISFQLVPKTLRCNPRNVVANVPLRRVCQRVNILREKKRALLAKGNRAVPIQAIFRGFMTRRDDKLLGVRVPRTRAYGFLSGSVSALG